MAEAELPDLPAGIYRHFKGALYQVLGYAQDSTNVYAVGGRIGVIYVPLELHGAHEGPRLKFRRAGEFLEHVCGNPACDDYGDPGFGDATCPSEHSVKRFSYLGPCLSPEMLR